MMTRFAIYVLLAQVAVAQQAPTLPPIDAGAQPPPAQRQRAQEPDFDAEAKAMYQAAIDNLETKLKELPKDAHPLKRAYLNFNLAVNHQRQGNDSKAEDLYLSAINDASGEEGKEIRARSHQNLGALKHSQARKVGPADQDKALKLLQDAKDQYVGAMAEQPHLQGTGENLDRLLRDRMVIEQLKHLQEQAQDAKKKAEEAHEAQEEANAAQGADKEEKQQEANEKTKEADKAVQDLADTARQQGMNEAADAVEQAREQYAKAQKAQEEAMKEDADSEARKASEEEAEEALEQAMRQVGVQPKPEEGEEGDPDQMAQKGEKGDEPPEDGDEQQQALAEPEPGDEGGEDGDEPDAAEPTDEEPEEDFDKMSALARLQAIQDRESDFKAHQKAEQMKKRARQGQVIKNW